MLCAVTSFDTLCGFRPVDDTVSLLHQLEAHDLAAFLQHEKLATTVAALYRGEFDIASTIKACAQRRSRRSRRWSPSWPRPTQATLRSS